MTENTPKSPARLLQEAWQIVRWQGGPDAWPDEFQPRGLAALMAGCQYKDDKRRYAVEAALISAGIKSGALAVRTVEEKRTKRGRTIDTGEQDVIARILARRVATTPDRVETLKWQFIDRQACAAWLRAIGENPSEFVRAWLGAECGQQKAESKVERKRAKIKEILGELESLDPDFCRDSMPGRKVDFFALCKEVARADFAHIREATFSDYLPGLCAFRKGARESDYYRKSLSELKVKLPSIESRKALPNLEEN